jgi:Zn-dependent peptidase ImmA (M78 family)/transcriptional regulator with XRE-family HTH domain
MTLTQTALIGTRLRAARERAGLTQQQLATALGIENRQSLASIESGERRLTAIELLDAIRVLSVDPNFFTDAFRLVGEGRFSFRAQAGIADSVLDQFEDRAGRWIATYRELSTQQGELRDLVELRLALHSRSTFEDAQNAAESLVARWKLGSRPAINLRQAMEQHLGALILYVDAPRGISGAASQVPGLNTVLVNRREPDGRRQYDLAHELFHLLTWDAMPPERVEAVDVPRSGKGNRVEQLAENFASALLMPADQVRAHWSARDQHVDMHESLRAAASEFHVSAVAYKWRLHNLGLLSKAQLLEINDKRLAASGASKEPGLALLFSERFVTRVAAALDAGRLSVKRAASLLELSLSELHALLTSYGIRPSFEA